MNHTNLSYISTDALFDAQCPNHRYMLMRTWCYHKKMATVVGLNPSRANATTDDPTIFKTAKLLNHNGFGGFIMVNVFSLIEPDSKKLKTAKLLCAAQQQKYLHHYLSQANHIVLAFGNLGTPPPDFYNWLKKTNAQLWCFGLNKTGTPKHPLYLKDTTSLIHFCIP